MPGALLLVNLVIGSGGLNVLPGAAKQFLQATLVLMGFVALAVEGRDHCLGVVVVVPSVLSHRVRPRRFAGSSCGYPIVCNPLTST